MTSQALLYTLASGLVLGSLYALMAVGLAVVWTTLGIFNFSHGMFIAIAAYIAWQVSDAGAWNLGLAAGSIITIAGVFGLGIIFQIIFIKPFEKKDNLVLLTVITTLAGASLLENTAVLTWGGRSKQLSRVIEGNLSIFGVTISAHEGMIIVLVPVLIFLLWLFLKKTHTGPGHACGFTKPRCSRIHGIECSKAVYAGIWYLSQSCRPGRHFFGLHSFYFARYGKRTFDESAYRYHLRWCFTVYKPGESRLCGRHHRSSQHLFHRTLLDAGSALYHYYRRAADQAGRIVWQI